MARSRSYQKSRKLGNSDDLRRRPTPSVVTLLTTFEGVEGNLIADLETDPVFSGKRLAFYLSPRTIRDLHRDARLGCGNDNWMLDPRIHNLIAMFPGPFWLASTLALALLIIGQALVVLLLSRQIGRVARRSPKAEPRQIRR